MRPVTVLHLTAHLGGGVGKALSGVVGGAFSGAFRHRVVCLERPEKPLFVDRTLAAGGAVIVEPDPATLAAEVAAADVVQLEWWNHPATIAALCRAALPPMRLLVWCHVSGLHTPVIPSGLLENAERFLFTSPCSYEAEAVARLHPAQRERLGVVHSCGGFDGFPEPARRQVAGMRAGYLGSLNFAKLHPDYVNFLKKVRIPGFTVRLVGDTLNREILERQCELAGRPGMLQFAGYTPDVVGALADIDTLVYLLNPEHYGTTENALLEAMAMGIVPVVLDNPAERHLVEDRKTGLVVRTPEELADALQWLWEHPEARREMGEQAAASVRTRFAVPRMVELLEGHYRAVLEQPKREIAFPAIFGADPAQWFLSCQAHPEIFTGAAPVPSPFSRHGLVEKTKGSVFHFQQHFPENERLRRWAETVATVN
ncbi:glycosyltransferase family 4 protein [Geomesophilobacter sediminis]|uniref:Glycosyltransferase family 4 protein n=1 Tax=Geomesophilobacter sediminis TaxID=2798584 RepID=A0A8J7M324_9BACT|nr:glycosyltransferase family 4 protein [Geomesophilobacter sediminis]MBJ6727753.1 glycosyltransferase family 4 protein [Geomesophilobacter sediminis]